MSTVDKYIKEVVNAGDDGSRLLAAICAPTLRNCAYVDVISEWMNGMAVLRIPEEYSLAVHSAAGAPAGSLVEHVGSLVPQLIYQARCIGAVPLAFADVVDASSADEKLVKEIGHILAASAEVHDVAIMNGELAILGEMVASDANVSATMVSMVSKRKFPQEGVVSEQGRTYVVIDPKGRAVFMNSDGVGTKTDIYARAGKFERSLKDSVAMKADDAIKYGARIKALLDVVERRGYIPTDILDQAAEQIGMELGAYYALHHEDVGDRLRSWQEGAPAFNVSGTAVSVVDEKYLTNPPVPMPGNHVIAIRGKPNPRSNGMTDNRRAVTGMFGDNWHETPEGQDFLEFLAEPSTIFYPLFRQLVEKGAATGVFHMSGGAYKGKLARPLASHRLYVRLENLFEPDPRQSAIAEFLSTPPEKNYEKWPMGNEGFITTGKPDQAVEMIHARGLEARDVGMVEKAENGRTGVELAGIKGSNGEDVYFSGRKQQ